VISVVGEVEKIEFTVSSSGSMEPVSLVLLLNVSGTLDLSKLLSGKQYKHYSIVYDSNKGLIMEVTNRKLIKCLIEDYSLEVGERVELIFSRDGDIEKVSFIR